MGYIICACLLKCCEVYLLAEIDLLKQYLVRKIASIARPTRLSVENHHRPVGENFGNYETFVSGRGIRQSDTKSVMRTIDTVRFTALA
jgi:hypothetical protein